MSQRRRSRAVSCLLIIIAAVSGGPVAVRAQTDRWADVMASFDQQDHEAALSTGGIVFVGSSSIRRWDLARSFPNIPVINRGFGGSRIVDSTEHVDLLVLRHKPR